MSAVDLMFLHWWLVEPGQQYSNCNLCHRLYRRDRGRMRVVPILVSVSLPWRVVSLAIYDNTQNTSYNVRVFLFLQKNPSPKDIIAAEYQHIVSEIDRSGREEGMQNVANLRMAILPVHFLFVGTLET